MDWIGYCHFLTTMMIGMMIPISILCPQLRLMEKVRELIMISSIISGFTYHHTFHKKLSSEEIEKPDVIILCPLSPFAIMLIMLTFLYVFNHLLVLRWQGFGRTVFPVEDIFFLEYWFRTRAGQRRKKIRYIHFDLTHYLSSGDTNSLFSLPSRGLIAVNYCHQIVIRIDWTYVVLLWPAIDCDVDVLWAERTSQLFCSISVLSRDFFSQLPSAHSWSWRPGASFPLFIFLSSFH